MTKHTNRGASMKYSAAVMAMVFSGMVFCTPALAQSLFRCGSTYQDQPCNGGKQTKIIGVTGTPPLSAKPVMDANCIQRGADAQKIVWAREGGAMPEQLLANARSMQEKKLIADVYRKRGTSSEVRTAIEADCVAEKERAERAAALIDAAKLQAPSTEAAAPIKSTETDAKAADTSRFRDNMTSDADRKKNICAPLNAQLENIQSRQRAGGSASTMESLNQGRRDIERQLRQAGC